MRPAARIAAATLAMAGAASLAVQPWVTADLLGAEPASAEIFSTLAGFFTILTNLLAVAAMTGIAVRGHAPGASQMGALTVWMLVVGGVYHALLADMWDPAGIALWADHGLHTVMPLGVFGWWLFYAPKTGTGPGAPLLWLIWPGLYGVYALGRGAITGWYPYPFLDVDALGVSGVAVNALWLGALFLAGGYVLVGLGRIFARMGG